MMKIKWWSKGRNDEAQRMVWIIEELAKINKRLNKLGAPQPTKRGRPKLRK